MQEEKKTKMQLRDKTPEKRKKHTVSGTRKQNCFVLVLISKKKNIKTLKEWKKKLSVLWETRRKKGNEWQKVK